MILFADVKFHDCEMCKEQFPTLSLLQVHMKCRHSGVLPLLLLTLPVAQWCLVVLYCIEKRAKYQLRAISMGKQGTEPMQ